MKPSDHINAIFKHCHALLDLFIIIIFREIVLDLRNKPVCEVEMTMYVNWRCINIDRKDDYS